MKNLRDPKTKIYPSTTRGGKELPSSSALDSPSVMSKFATPTSASVAVTKSTIVILDQVPFCAKLNCYFKIHANSIIKTKTEKKDCK